jgi:hypothetical protein
MVAAFTNHITQTTETITDSGMAVAEITLIDTVVDPIMPRASSIVILIIILHYLSNQIQLSGF